MPPLPAIVAIPARRDLLEIRDWYRAQSPTAARKVGSALRSAITRLARSPNLGHERPDLAPPGVRFFLVYSYYVVYEQRDRNIVIVRVLHASRDVNAILGGP